MGKCKICGTDIPDGQELCEKCQNDLEEVSQEDLDLGGLDDFDFSNIELPELSGDVFETDLEFKLEDPGNDLENPDIFVHDFDIDENITDMELPEFQDEGIPTSVDLTEAGSFEATEDGIGDIPDISDILEGTVQMDSNGLNEDLDIQEVETASDEKSDVLSQIDEELMSILEESDISIDEPSGESRLSENTDNSSNETSKNQKEVDLLDLLPESNDQTDSMGNFDSEADSGFVDDLLSGLDLGGMAVSESESDIEKDKKREIFTELDDDLGLMEDLPDMDSLTNVVPSKPKISIWKRLFGNIKDEKWEKQKEKEEKLEAEKLAKAEEEKAKAAERETEEEKEKLDSKEVKKAEKQAKKEEKARKKEEKKAEKQKMKELAELEDTDEGRINRVGAAIVFVFFGIMAAFVIFGTNSFSYNSSISRAAAYFEEDEYNSAYDALWGLKIKEKDAELYSKVQMVMYLNKEWNSYENYTNIRMYPEALDSLLKGIRKYDSHIDDARELEVSADYKKIRSEILKKLKDEYGLNEKDIYEILSIENQEDYSKEVIQLANES